MNAPASKPQQRIEAERDALERAAQEIARIRIMDSLSAIHMRAIARGVLRELDRADRAA